MKVAEDIERVAGVRVSNAYVVTTGDGLLVVDTGIPGNAGRIVAAVERLGRRPGDVRTIVLTHSHPDHVGSAARLKRLTGARVAIHEADAPVLDGREPPGGGRIAMRLVYRVLRLRPLAPDLLLRDGDRVGGLEVIHVPGHTPGSIVLRRDDGVVFSGDALLGDSRGGIRPPDPRLAIDPDQAAASAAKIRGLGPTLLLPGHGQPARP